jgi:hypothetical protein
MTAAPDVLGLVGVVVSRLRGTAGPGEVRVVHGGLPHTYIAHANQVVPAGTHVLVIGTRGGRQLDVEPWPVHTPYSQKPAGNGQQARS